MLSGSLSISVDSARQLMSELQDEELPEYSFLDDIAEKMKPKDPPKTNRFGAIIGPGCRANVEEATSDPIPIPRLAWCFTGSGYTFDRVLLKKIVPHLQGEAEIVYIWERGDSLTGLRIKDGKAQKCNVSYTLVPK
jgi:hypothetical protein